jgi:hypothetical protein
VYSMLLRLGDLPTASCWPHRDQRIWRRLGHRSVARSALDRGSGGSVKVLLTIDVFRADVDGLSGDRLPDEQRAGFVDVPQQQLGHVTAEAFADHYAHRDHVWNYLGLVDG